MAGKADDTGHDYIRYDGKKYLFTFTPIGDTGMIICTLILQKTVLAEKIRRLSVQANDLENSMQKFILG